MVLINSLFWFVHLETTANNMKCFTSFTIPLCLLFFAISSGNKKKKKSHPSYALNYGTWNGINIYLIFNAFSECWLAFFFIVGQDTDCDETLEEFEEEFGQYAVDPDLVEEWKENLEEAEEEINEQNQKYQDGESTFWDALNEFSELSDEDFLKEKTGLIPQEGDDRITYATGLLEMPKRLSRKISMWVNTKKKSLFYFYNDWFPFTGRTRPSLTSLLQAEATPLLLLILWPMGKWLPSRIRAIVDPVQPSLQPPLPRLACSCRMLNLINWTWVSRPWLTAHSMESK